VNLLFFISSLGGGGAERVTANLANHWAGKGWNVVVVTLAPISQDAYSLDPSVKRIASNFVGNSSNLFHGVVANIRRVQALRRVLREFNPDVVLGMMTTTAVLAIIASMGLRCRVIVSERIHPAMVSIGWLWDMLRRFTYPWAFCVVMQTTEGSRWLATHIPKAKGAVIANPVPFPLPAGKPILSPLRTVAPGRSLLLAVGRLDVQKGFGALLESFAFLALRYPLWDLVLLGEGPERSRLEQQVASLGLQSRVSLPGRAGNIAEWYSRADLYVMSSRFEGFPNTLAESMAHGCAAVSYDCDTGPRDIIRHEVDGLLVTPGDGRGLAASLDRLMGDPALRLCFAERAVEVRDRFSMERIAGMWESLFKEAA
jgi:glycosyltransferase involved in cell wall biosynthesis